MSTKRLSVRFNLDIDDDKKAWNYLEKVSGSKNQRVIDAINISSNLESSINSMIKKSIKECLGNVSVTIAGDSKPSITDDEIMFMDNIETFLGE